ncbi:MAG: radical SAM protein [Lachnospiraceae bacterium]|nr:radical SAM protein [Lachnospiraceae bacterium]
MAYGDTGTECLEERGIKIMGCVLCPRQCSIDRANGRGYCGESVKVRVARASLHMWEEPCISGKTGSGTVFFSGCSLKCVFCQNRKIASGDRGKALTILQLVNLFLLLQDKGAANINLVTPTHFTPQIAEALRMSKSDGLSIPVVYNTSGYEQVETLRMLDGLVDIYLPDLKYYSGELSARYSNAPDYFTHASLAVAEMVRQVGVPVFGNMLSGEEMMKRGVIVRHMVMPGHVRDSKQVIKYLHDTYKEDIYISIMNQYTPPDVMEDYPEISRRVTRREYKRVIDYAMELGIENAFVQEGNTAEESFIPDFDEEMYLKEIKC